MILATRILVIINVETVLIMSVQILSYLDFWSYWYLFTEPLEDWWSRVIGKVAIVTDRCIRHGFSSVGTWPTLSSRDYQILDAWPMHAIIFHGFIYNYFWNRVNLWIWSGSGIATAYLDMVSASRSRRWRQGVHTHSKKIPGYISPNAVTPGILVRLVSLPRAIEKW